MCLKKCQVYDLYDDCQIGFGSFYSQTRMVRVGLIVGDDVTHVLARGYWPSYNVPYWPEVYSRSGYGRMSAKYGNAFR